MKHELELNSSDNKDEVLKKINSMGHLDESTNTGLALFEMRTKGFSRANGDRPNVPNVAVVVTDGNPTVPDEVTGTANTKSNATAAKDQDIIIFAIGVGADVDQSILDAIASPGKTESVVDESALVDIIDQIRAFVCEAVGGNLCSNSH